MLNGRTYRTLLLPTFGIAIVAGAPVIWAAQAKSVSPNVVQMVNVVADLEKTIDAKKSKAGEDVNAKTTAEATLGDGTKIPAGSVLAGHIGSITPSENKGNSTVVLTFDKLDIKNGKELPIKAVVVRVASYSSSYGPELASGPETNDSNASSATSASSGSGMNGQGGGSKGPHSIEGLTLTGSASDASSATLTQAKKNIHLTGSTQLIVSVALLP